MEIRIEAPRSLGRPVPEFSEAQLARKVIQARYQPPGNTSVTDLAIEAPWTTAVPGVLQFKATYLQGNMYGELNKFADIGTVNLTALLGASKVSPEAAQKAVTITEHQFLGNMRASSRPSSPPDSWHPSTQR